MSKRIIICKSCGEPKKLLARGMCCACYQRGKKTSNWGICNICGNESYIYAAGACRSCYEKSRYLKNVDRITSNKLRYAYGIILEEYDEMLESQNNCCLICGMTPEENGKRLSVDHDHKTGEVRGLLCSKCNHGIGLFQDSPVLLARAIEYLTHT